MKLIRFSSALTFVSILIALSCSTAHANQWFVNSSTGADTLDGTSPTVLGGNVGPFQTIQWAVLMSLPGDSVYVSDGYYYGNVILDKSIFLFGNNAGISGYGSRIAETILLPDAEDLSRGPNALNTILYITSPGVFIDGLRLDGDNTGLVSGNDVRGRDVDISYGLSNAALFDNIVVVNNVFENLNVSGIIFRGNVNSFNTNCVIQGNLLTNFGDNSVGIQCEGFYSDLFANIINEADIGIWFNDYRTSNGRSWQVNGNFVYANVIGFMIENCYGNTSSLFVENNTISTPAGIISDWGVYLNNNRDNFKVRFTNNKISNTGEGYSLNNNNLPPIIFDRDSISDCDFGMRLNNFNNNGKTDSILINTCMFNTCNVAGIDFFNDSSRVELILNNSIIKNSAEGILLQGNCHVEPNNTAFDNIQLYYISFDNALSDLVSSTDVDATNCTFNGFTGAGSSDSINFLTEDKIRHYLDDNVFAFVTFKAETIYITTNDGNFWITPAFAKASDNWHVFLDTVNSPEDVTVTKQLHFHTRGLVSIGSFIMDAPGKTLFLHGPLFMSNTLTLNNGLMNTTDGIATIGQPLFSPPFNRITGGNPTSYVEGPLRVVVQTVTTDTIYFPVGKSGDFRPISFLAEASVLGALGTIEGEAFQGPAPFQNLAPGLTHTSLIHHWRTNNMDGLPFDMVRVGGSYSLVVNDDEVTDPNNLRLVVAENGSWNNIGGVGSAVGNGFIVSTNNNTTMSYVSLANAAKGSNSLGKAGAIAAFDITQSCFPDSVQFTDISASTGGVIIGWNWNFGDTSTLGDTSFFQNPKYQFPKPGSYNVTLMVLNASGERDTVTRTIVIQAPPVAGFDMSIPCFPSAAIFIDTSTTDASDPIVSWLWSVNGNPYTTTLVSHVFASPGTYSVGLRVTSSMGCTDTTTIDVFQGDTVRISIVPAAAVSICEGEQVTLTASSGINRYLWSTGDTASSILVDLAGTYVVTGFNGNQCFDTDTVIVSVLPGLTADAGPDQTIRFGESTTLSGFGGGSYEWIPASGLSDKNIANPVASPSKTTAYVLRVFNSFGCEDFDTMILTVEPFENIDVPNLITPNEDGLNDIWDLSIVPGYDSAKVSVINRWGKEVFMSLNYKNDWAGTYNKNDQPLPDGSYLFIIENKETFGTIKGSLQILR